MLRRRSPSRSPIGRLAARGSVISDPLEIDHRTDLGEQTAHVWRQLGSVLGEGCRRLNEAFGVDEAAIECGQYVPQWIGTAARGRISRRASAARSGSRCRPRPSIGPQPQTGISATSMLGPGSIDIWSNMSVSPAK